MQNNLNQPQSTITQSSSIEIQNQIHNPSSEEIDLPIKEHQEEEVEQNEPLLQNKLNDSMEQQSNTTQLLKWIAFLMFSVIILALLFIVFYNMPKIMSKTQAMFEWIQENPFQGCIAYLFIVFITGVLMFPIFLISIAGAISFKVAFGRITSFMITLIIGSLGYYAACIVSFIIGRIFCYKCSRRCLNRYDIFQALDGGFEQHGIQLSFLLRASFMVPYNVLNVVMGVTKISFKDYAIGTTAITTHILFNALVGISLSDLTNVFHGKYKDNIFYFWTMVIGTIITIVLFILMCMIVNKQLKEIVEKRKQKQNLKKG